MLFWKFRFLLHEWKFLNALENIDFVIQNSILRMESWNDEGLILTVLGEFIGRDFFSEAIKMGNMLEKYPKSSSKAIKIIILNFMKQIIQKFKF